MGPVGTDAGTGLDERRSEMLAHLERGDLGPLDAGIDEGRPWCGPLSRAMRALLEGRTHECQRHNHDAGTTGSCVIQTLHLRVAQGRLAEMEVPVRALAAEPSTAGVARASLAWLLGLLGRDREAGAELSGLAQAGGFSGLDRRAVAPARTGGAQTERDRLAALVTLAEVAAMLERRTEATELFDLLLPHRFRITVDGDGAVCYGSVSRHLGLLAHVLGRWDEADTHFQNALVANRGIGAPLLVAHTCREWSALLRARGDGHDWDRALDLLTDAEAVYRRLGVDEPAADAQAVLARATAHADASVNNAFRRDGHEWVLGHGGRLVRLGDATGMGYLMRLLAHPGQAFHVADLSGAAVATGLGRADERPPWGAAGGDGVRRGSAALDEGARQEYRERLDELDRGVTRAVDAGDRMEAALGRAERDRLMAELDAATDRRSPSGDPLADPLEQARLGVATAVRLSLDRIDTVHPDLGRHLRLTVRTGMFCAYVPSTPTTWRT